MDNLKNNYETPKEREQATRVLDLSPTPIEKVRSHSSLYTSREHYIDMVVCGVMMFACGALAATIAYAIVVK